MTEPEPLAPEQLDEIDWILFLLSEQSITRDDANERIAQIDLDWSKRGNKVYVINPKIKD